MGFVGFCMGAMSYFKLGGLLGHLEGFLGGVQKKAPSDGGPLDWKARGYAANAKNAGFETSLSTFCARRSRVRAVVSAPFVRLVGNASLE